MNGFLKDITYARSGEYILSIYTRESCKDIWKNFGERPITFTITKKADPRGLRANSYTWALIEQLAAKLKTDKESVYEEMIRRYGVGESYIDETGNECKVLFSLRDGVPPRLGIMPRLALAISRERSSSTTAHSKAPANTPARRWLFSSTESFPSVKNWASRRSRRRNQRRQRNLDRLLRLLRSQSCAGR